MKENKFRVLVGSAVVLISLCFFAVFIASFIILIKNHSENKEKEKCIEMVVEYYEDIDVNINAISAVELSFKKGYRHGYFVFVYGINKEKTRITHVWFIEVEYGKPTNAYMIQG